jgi:carbonic anhydrase
MSTTDELLSNAQAYAETFNKGDLPLPPARKIAVLACMDARLNPYGLLGLQEGDAHVIRNAGGVVTDDEIRSLAISQRLLGTEEIVLIHHTDCGMLTFTDDEFKRAVQDEVGIKPEWAAEAFADLEEDVRQSIARIRSSPFIPHKESVRGFVYDVHAGAPRSRPVTLTSGSAPAKRNQMFLILDRNLVESTSDRATRTVRPAGPEVRRILSRSQVRRTTCLCR